MLRMFSTEITSMGVCDVRLSTHFPSSWKPILRISSTEMISVDVDVIEIAERRPASG
jgi:hypothetical protein